MKKERERKKVARSCEILEIFAVARLGASTPRGSVNQRLEMKLSSSPAGDYLYLATRSQRGLGERAACGRDSRNERTVLAAKDTQCPEVGNCCFGRDLAQRRHCLFDPHGLALFNVHNPHMPLNLAEGGKEAVRGSSSAEVSRVVKSFQELGYTSVLAKTYKGQQKYSSTSHIFPRYFHNCHFSHCSHFLVSPIFLISPFSPFFSLLSSSLLSQFSLIFWPRVV